MPPKIEKRSTLLILNSSTEMLECGIPWIWHSSLQCPLKACNTMTEMSNSVFGYLYIKWSKSSCQSEDIGHYRQPTSLSAWQPSTWNRERWGPANPLQLQILVEAWASPPLRPLGTSPPRQDLGDHMSFVSGRTLELVYLQRIDLWMLTKIGNASRV